MYLSKSNPQGVLKPQDLVVLLKLVALQGHWPTYSVLAVQLQINEAEIHAGISRAEVAQLVVKPRGEPPRLIKAALRELVTQGARYVFPAVRGEVTRGLPTGYAAAPLNTQIVQPNDLPPVWPYPKGSVRGVALFPLYPTVPQAALQDAALYELLALFDGVRAGSARERSLAIKILSERIH